MGLTAEDLKKRPVLAKQLVRQHLILRSNGELVAVMTMVVGPSKH